VFASITGAEIDSGGPIAMSGKPDAAFKAILSSDPAAVCSGVGR
jgi:hypothetical protein